MPLNQDDREELAQLGVQIGAIARRDPSLVVMAALEYLLERSCGDNTALLDYYKLKAYRSILAKILEHA